MYECLSSHKASINDTRSSRHDPMKRSCLLFTFLMLLLPGVLHADWPCLTDSTQPVAVAPGNQWNQRVVTDGHSGAIVVWQDRRGGTTDKIYVQRISASGNPLWLLNGIAVASTNGYQYYPQLAPDGNGGAYIVWQDIRSGVSYDIYAQRVDANGNFLWQQNGVLLSNSAGQQYNPQLIAADTSGIFVTWQDNRSGAFDIYVQRVDPTGAIRWGSTGLLVCGAASDQIEPMITTDGNHGAYIGWLDYRAGTGTTDIYCQRITSTGTVAWQTDGVPACTAPNLQWNLTLIPDGAGGTVLVWQDRRSGTYDNIFAQRIVSSGKTMWASDGIQIAAMAANQYYPQAVLDGGGGYVVVWQDNRNGTDYDIYAQRVASNGGLLWNIPGTSICAAAGNQYNPQIVGQGMSVFVTWQDRRGSDFNIYCQRLNLVASPYWHVDGVPVATMPLDQIDPAVVSDGFQGGIIVWDDYHLNTGSTDLFAHRIGSNGLPAGGCYRSFAQDSLGLRSIRFKKGKGVIIAKPNAGNVRDSVFARGAFPNAILLGIDRRDSARYYGWVYFTGSLYVRNGLPQGITPRPFAKILDRDFTGKMRNPTNKRYNNRLLGELLALKLNIGISDAGLTQSEFGDLVYHDTSVYAQMINGKRLRDLVLSVDSVMTEYRKFTSINYSYIATALHTINNAFDGTFDTVSTSPLKVKSTRPVFSIPFLTTSTLPATVVPAFTPAPPADEELPNKFTLYQNYPNPFNPYTRIEYVLTEPSIVTLKVYNILGQEVATLIDHTAIEDGHQLIDFDATNIASGVYFYRMIAEPLSGHGYLTQVKKMMVIR